MHCNREHSALSNVQRPKRALHEMRCLQCASVLWAASGLPRGRRAQQKERYKQHGPHCSTDISSTAPSSVTAHTRLHCCNPTVRTAESKPSPPSFTAQLVLQVASLQESVTIRYTFLGFQVFWQKCDLPVGAAQKYFTPLLGNINSRTFPVFL